MVANPILLDTCAAIWIVAGRPLKPEAEEAIDLAYSQGEKVRLSPITAWEVGLLAARGRFKSTYSPQRWIAVLQSLPQIALAEMPPHVLVESSLLPGNPGSDPADRILAATAREFGYTLMTADSALLDYARQGFISALEC